MSAFTFNAETHEYRVGALPVPSCTSVLHAGGLVQFRFVSEEVLERKSELGREVHRACHLHNIDKLGAYDDRVKPRLHAWISFKEACKTFRLISSEYQCVATVNGMPYGMQLDCNAMINGHDTIVEYKIGKIYPHHAVQAAGYAAGTPHPQYTAPLARFTARKRVVVELKENGNFHAEWYEDKSDFNVFCSLLHIASWKGKYDSFYKEKR